MNASEKGHSFISTAAVLYVYSWLCVAMHAVSYKLFFFAACYLTPWWATQCCFPSTASTDRSWLTSCSETALTSTPPVLLMGFQKTIIINAFLMLRIPLWYTRVRLKALHTKHYNNTQPNLIMHYISRSIPPPPLHPHMCTHTHTHTHTYNLATPNFPSLSQSLSTSHPLKSASEDQNQYKIKYKSCWCL